MHVSTLSKKFQRFVGRHFALHDNNQPDTKCPHTRRLNNQMQTLGNTFMAEVVFNGAQPRTRARCVVQVDTDTNNRITDIQAAVRTL